MSFEELILFFLTGLIYLVIIILERITEDSCCENCLRKAIKKRNTAAALDMLSGNLELLDQFSNIKECKKLWLECVRSGNVLMVRKGLDMGSVTLLKGPQWKSVKSVAHNVFRSKNRNSILRLLLKHGLDVVNLKKEGNFGHNLLHWFIAVYAYDDQESVETAKILLSAGIPVDEINAFGFSALFITIFEKKMKLASLFINTGADVNKVSIHGVSVLNFACWINNSYFIKLLVKNGADVNHKNKGLEGYTPLHAACSYNNEEVIKYLLKEGANISEKNDDDETPFSLLEPRLDNYEFCLIAMIKEFSKLSFENISICEADMDLIDENEKISEHFNHCILELALMSTKKFYKHLTYYSLLNMSGNMNKLARLTNIEEFVTNFKENLYCFFFYKEDLKSIFAEALNLRDDLLVVDSRLKAVFGEFLPEIVIKNLGDYLTKEDLPQD